MRKSRRTFIILGCVVVGCVIIFHFQFQHKIEKRIHADSNQDIHGLLHFKKIPETVNLYDDIYHSSKIYNARADKLFFDKSSNSIYTSNTGDVRNSKRETQKMQKIDDDTVTLEHSSILNKSLPPKDRILLDISIPDSDSRGSFMLDSSSSHASNQLYRNSNSVDKLAVSQKNQNALVEPVESQNTFAKSYVSARATNIEEIYKDSFAQNKLTDYNSQGFSSLPESMRLIRQQVTVAEQDDLQLNGFNVNNNINYKKKTKNVVSIPSPKDDAKDNLEHMDTGRLSNAGNFAKDTFAKDINELKYEPLPMKPSQNHRIKAHGNIWPFDLYDKDINSQISKENSPISSSTKGIKVVSMSLYGTNRRYIVGALHNAELIKMYFPGWTLRIYAISPTSNSASKHPPLSSDIVESLRNLGSDIQYVTPELDFVPPMMWRFLVADDLSVDRFIIRDSDSRLSERDAACVAAWVQSGKPFLSVRDHPSHAGYAISGGLWGGQPTSLRNILRRSWIDLMKGLSANYLSDMNFLNDIIWPKVKDWHLHSCDSVSCDKWPSAFPFPVERRGYEHVGAVYDEHDLIRPGDAKILLRAGENVNCLPKNTTVAKVLTTRVLQPIK